MYAWLGLAWLYCEPAAGGRRDRASAARRARRPPVRVSALSTREEAGRNSPECHTFKPSGPPHALPRRRRPARSAPARSATPKASAGGFRAPHPPVVLRRRLSSSRRRPRPRRVECKGTPGREGCRHAHATTRLSAARARAQRTRRAPHPPAVLRRRLSSTRRRRGPCPPRHRAPSRRAAAARRGRAGGADARAAARKEASSGVAVAAGRGRPRTAPERREVRPARARPSSIAAVLRSRHARRGARGAVGTSCRRPACPRASMVPTAMTVVGVCALGGACDTYLSLQAAIAGGQSHSSTQERLTRSVTGWTVYTHMVGFSSHL